MGDVINLREVRKRRERADKDRQAAENRVRFGRTKAEKTQIRREEERRLQDLDGKRREGEDGEEDGTAS